MKRMCVYCSSSAQIAPAYFEATAEVARILVEHRYHVVYGGGAVGLMGTLADAALAAGGRVTGVIPRFMVDVEWAHPGVKEMVLTDTMAERKAKLLEGADAVLALPGGTGTLEELFEALTLKRLGLFIRPIAILNTNGFYDPLKTMLDRCIEEKFMSPRNRDVWRFVDRPDEIVDAVANAPAWGKNAIDFAVMK